jgi:hypothetical protein
MIRSTAPTESSLTTAAFKTRYQVPSAVQRRSRSCAVFHGRSARAGSATGPVHSFHRIALITRR